MSRRLLIILVLGLAVLVWGWFDGPAARQRRGYSAAHAHSSRIESTLNAMEDSRHRFDGVTVSYLTVPSLVVRGYVHSESDLRELKSIVGEATDPTYRVVFQVRIEPTTQPAK